MEEDISDSLGEEVSVMATSSITKNFVVSGKEQAEKFADAIEQSLNNPTPPIKVNAVMVQGSEELKKLMAKRKKTNG